jgi:hypothetical protein
MKVKSNVKEKLFINKEKQCLANIYKKVKLISHTPD